MADAETVVEVVAPPARRGPDILVRTAPPLSATSDAPLTEVAKPPPSASNDPADQANGVAAEMSPEAQAAARLAKVDPGEADAGNEVDQEKLAAAVANDEIETIEVDGKAVPLPPWMKREITKARNRQRDAEGASKTHTDEIAALKTTLDELRAKVETPPPVEVVTDARPTRDKFDDPDAYDEALTQWAEREGQRKATAKVEADKAEATKLQAAEAAEALKIAQETEIARMRDAWNAKVAKATEKYPDYAEVAMNDAVKISFPMAHAIGELENGTDVAYFLGQNPEEAARISALPGIVSQHLQIAAIGARLAAPTRAAPRARPIEPITGAGARSDVADREPSMDEVAARVNARYAAQRRPFVNGAVTTH